VWQINKCENVLRRYIISIRVFPPAINSFEARVRTKWLPLRLFQSKIVYHIPQLKCKYTPRSNSGTEDSSRIKSMWRGLSCQVERLQRALQRRPCVRIENQLGVCFPYFPRGSPYLYVALVDRRARTHWLSKNIQKEQVAGCVCVYSFGRMCTLLGSSLFDGYPSKHT